VIDLASGRNTKICIGPPQRSWRWSDEAEDEDDGGAAVITDEANDDDKGDSAAFIADEAIDRAFVAEEADVDAAFSDSSDAATCVELLDDDEEADESGFDARRAADKRGFFEAFFEAFLNGEYFFFFPCAIAAMEGRGTVSSSEG